MRVREIMTAKPITIDPEMPMLEARQRMAENASATWWWSTTPGWWASSPTAISG